MAWQKDTLDYLDPKNIDSFMPVDKKTIRAYVNTPATAKLDLAVTYRQSHLVGFFVGSQKNQKNNWIR